MRNFLLFLGCLALAASTFGQAMWETNGKHVQLYPTRGQGQSKGKARPGGGSGQNLSYHNGPVIHGAKVIPIFWGNAWGSGTPSQVANQLIGFFEQFGTNSEYNVITQYYDKSGGKIALGTLTYSGDAWFDGSNPSSTNVTDANMQSEVIKYFTSGHAVDTSAVYEVFIPSGYYSSYGSYDSCGGPNLYYCAYHSNFTYNGQDIKYASMPYPSCSGCQWPGWSDAQNLDHFGCHETREAVTDPDGSAWYDRRGNEADDKCAWSPSPFLDGGYGYQYEWSNANSGCVPSQ
jgi:hypothetical protein